MATIYHALILNLHQPAGNLEQLLAYKEWEANEILLAIDRIPRSLWDYDDIARVHLSISGTLLETFSNPDFQERVRGVMDVGSLLWYLQNTRIFNILATAYYHPVLPTIPEADWDEHLRRWRGIGEHLFNRSHFLGFWPPEMGFSMNMIPHLTRLGYRYVVVDCDHVAALENMTWSELMYRPHVARYGDDEIIVIVRDRSLSNAQEAGMDYEWFAHEVYERTKSCTFPPLVTTCTNGADGGWFRNANQDANFWGHFYRPWLQKIRHGESDVRPIVIDEYLDLFGANGEVTVSAGAWNTGGHDGKGFTQWSGTEVQRDALTRVSQVSQAFHVALGEVQALVAPSLRELEEGYWHLLRAETSCNFFWGDSWIDRCHQDLDNACKHLGLTVMTSATCTPRTLTQGEQEDALYRAYETREQYELMFYEADARRKAAFSLIENMTINGYLFFDSVAELGPPLVDLHEQLLQETRSAIKYGTGMHRAMASIRNWMRRTVEENDE